MRTSSRGSTPSTFGASRGAKRLFRRSSSFRYAPTSPLFVAIGELHSTSGLGVLAAVLPRLVRNDVQVAILARGATAEPEALANLDEQQSRWPDRVAVIEEAAETDVHRGLGAADFVIVPSAAEHSSVHLRAHRYGALPIAPRSGAVLDEVVDCDPDLKSGTGFLYDAQGDPGVEFLGALQRAVAAFQSERAFTRSRRRAMRTDHSWERPAYLFERLYAGVGKTTSGART